MTLIVVPHWSATRFMTWDVCPGEYQARYVDERPVQLTEAMAFGSAVHMGLEAHFNNDDGIRAFRAAWRQFTVELGGDVDRGLTAMGLNLIDQVQDLGLSGVPERGFSLDTNTELGAPIIGSIDLWGTDTIFDFKTTRGLWSQERAQKEVWQPAIYTMARFAEDAAYEGNFEYIVLNRVTGKLQRLRREWSASEVVALWDAAWDRMRLITNDIRAGRFVCHGNHGYCPECGNRWAHDHDCHPTTQGVRVRGRPPGASSA